MLQFFFVGLSPSKTHHVILLSFKNSLKCPLNYYYFSSSHKAKPHPLKNVPISRCPSQIIVPDLTLDHGDVLIAHANALSHDERGASTPRSARHSHSHFDASSDHVRPSRGELHFRLPHSLDLPPPPILLKWSPLRLERVPCSSQTRRVGRLPRSGNFSLRPHLSKCVPERVAGQFCGGMCSRRGGS